MGGESSYPILSTSQLYFVLVGQNVQEIPYSIPPGHPVISLNLQKNLIRHLPNGLLQLKTLILNDNALEEINEEMKSALLSYTSLKTLELAQNLLTEFNILIPSLETLNLIQNRLTIMPPLSENLQKASFDFNVIKVFDKSSATIKTLSMALNYIDKVENTLKMDSLESLDCSMNRISLLDNFSTMFPIVKTVNLSFNMIEVFPHPLSNSIVELDLSGNSIETFSEDIRNLTNLKKLDISFNQLKELPELPKSLKLIYADNNQIQKVADAEMPSLEFAIFSCNKLESLPKLTNHVSPSLLFCHNNIKLITLDMMIRPVEQLNLADNDISEIPAELFKMPRLRILNLDANKITEIPEAIDQSNISALLISQNPIKKLPKLPKSLDSLFACYCEIEDVAEIFSNCLKITKICLCGNKIKNFPSPEAIKFPYLQILSLSQCELDNFPSEFLIDEDATCKILSLDISFNKIKEIPVNFSAPYLTDLDISHNQLTSVPEFSKYPRLVSIKLANNPISCNMSLLKNEVLDSIDVTCTKVNQINVIPSIREVLTSAPNLSNPFRFINAKKSGYAQAIGIKNISNDSISVRDDINFYLLCDGHDGSQTATVVANILPYYFQNSHQFHGDFFETAISSVDNHLRNEIHVKDGSTIICAEIDLKTNEVITAHLGDARAVIVSNDGSVRTLTRPHVPTVRREFERIMHSGGRVVQRKTNGMLSISRALGDYQVVGLSSTPEISHVMINPDDKFMVMACSGLFLSVTNEEVARLIVNCTSAWDAAYRLKNLAFARKSIENISVIVVPLNINK